MFIHNLGTLSPNRHLQKLLTKDTYTYVFSDSDSACKIIRKFSIGLLARKARKALKRSGLHKRDCTQTQQPSIITTRSPLKTLHPTIFFHCFLSLLGAV
jgi:hypothetical protein